MPRHTVAPHEIPGFRDFAVHGILPTAVQSGANHQHDQARSGSIRGAEPGGDRFLMRYLVT